MKNNKFNFNSYLYRNREKDIYFAEDDLKMLRNIIQIYCVKHPDASAKEIKESMRKFINNCAFDLKDCSSPRSETVKYYTYKRLTHDKDLFKRTYKRVISNEHEENDEKNQNSYSNNPEQANEMLVKEFLKIDKTFKLYSENNKEFYLKHKQEAENAIIENFGAIYLKYFKYKCNGKDDDALYTLLFSKDIDVPTEEHLKENHIKIIKKVGERLEQFGELSKDNENNNKLMNRYNFEGLEYPMESDNKEETLGIKDIFKKETLENLSLLQISSIETFWVNRYAKILESLSNALMIADQFDLFEKLKNGEKITISEDEIRYVFQKQNILYGISRDIADSISSKASQGISEENEQGTIGKKNTDKNQETIGKMNEENEQETISEKDTDEKQEMREKTQNNKKSIVTVDADEIFNEIYKKMGSRYHEHFSEMNPNYENDLEKDFENSYDYNSAKCITYQMKDFSMAAIIYNIVNAERKINWGVVENTITNKKVVLSVDVPELNMPLRLHIEKEKLIQFFNEFQGNAIIPKYDGANDFELEGKTLPTNVLMLLGKKQKEFIKKELKEDEDIKSGKLKMYPRITKEINFLEHINYLGNVEEYPKHLGRPFVKKVKGKKITGYKQKQYEYIDLETNKQYKKDENKKFVEIEDTRMI